MASCLENGCIGNKPHNKDLFEFAREIKESFTDLIKRELKELKKK